MFIHQRRNRHDRFLINAENRHSRADGCGGSLIWQTGQSVILLLTNDRCYPPPPYGTYYKTGSERKKLQIAVFFDLEFLYLDGHRQTSQAVFTREK